MTTPQGTAWRLEEMLPLGRLRGRAPVIPHTYLDIETTGLAGGSGTIAFSVAMCRPGPAGMELVQLFLKEPAGEPAFLWALGAELERSLALATYNGSSFDLPLLRTRWLMARMGGDLRHPEHVDLLHLTRGLHRQRLDSCRLRVVEERLLGFDREGDLPGAIVAEAYLAYLRRGWSPWLEAALEHNRQDVLSLWHLHARLLQRLDLADPSVETSADWLALGRQLIRRGRRADAWRAFRCAVELDQGDAAVEAGLHMARRLARLGRPGAAEELLAALQERRPRSLMLTISRAKLLEWRLRRPDQALSLIERSLALGDITLTERATLESRRLRLSQRLQRSRVIRGRVGR